MGAQQDFCTFLEELPSSGNPGSDYPGLLKHFLLRLVPFAQVCLLVKVTWIAVAFMLLWGIFRHSSQESLQGLIQPVESSKSLPVRGCQVLCIPLVPGRDPE